jgi:hypothetical protein
MYTHNPPEQFSLVTRAESTCVERCEPTKFEHPLPFRLKHAARVAADSPLACIRCARATLDWSSALGRPMDWPRGRDVASAKPRARQEGCPPGGLMRTFVPGGTGCGCCGTGMAAS